MATYRSDFFLKPACALVPLATLFTLALFRSGDVVSAQMAPVAPVALGNIMVKQKHFMNYQKTFVQFAQSNLGSMDEYEVAMNLEATSTITVDYLAAVATLLEIYGDLD